MKAVLIGALLSLTFAATLTSCGGQELPPPVGLEGTFDLVEAGQLVFVTSTAANELRVLRAFRPEEGQRDFVRAPNPLRPLSIPLRTNSPLELVTDVSFTDVGASQYVFARGAGDQISIIGAEESSLRELGIIRGAGAITAMAAVKASPTESRLYFAADVAGSATLFSLTLGAPDTVTELTTPVALATLPGEAIVALTILPDGLAVGTRSLSGTAGRTFVASREGLEVLPLAFPFPVRALYTNPAYPDQPAGTRVYGLLEEQACPDQTCAGILAADVASGVLVNGTPIAFGDALPLDLGLAPNVTLRNTAGTTALLGIVPVSDGRIYFVDLASMSAIESSNSDGPFPDFSFDLSPRSFSAFTFPAAAVYSLDQRVAFVAYPSANGILEFIPEAIRPHTSQDPITNNIRGIR